MVTPLLHQISHNYEVRAALGAAPKNASMVKGPSCSSFHHFYKCARAAQAQLVDKLYIFVTSARMHAKREQTLASGV